MTDLERLREREAKLRRDAQLTREVRGAASNMAEADRLEERADALLATIALTDVLWQVFGDDGSIAWALKMAAGRG